MSHPQYLHICHMHNICTPGVLEVAALAEGEGGKAEGRAARLDDGGEEGSAGLGNKGLSIS